MKINIRNSNIIAFIINAKCIPNLRSRIPPKGADKDNDNVRILKKINYL